MSLRQTVILAVVFLLGVLTASVFIGRPVAAEPKADATAAGRYQVVPITNHNNSGSIVVMDVATGECWSNETNGEQTTWHSMGSPTKAK